MAEQGSEERAGGMEGHAQQPYTVETLAHRNTVWRCVVWNHMVNLIPGQYRSDLEEAGP